MLHDLGLEHLLLNRLILRVAALVNVEEAGYFPEEMQWWTFGRAELEALCGDEDLARRHIGLLSLSPTLTDGGQER